MMNRQSAFAFIFLCLMEPLFGQPWSGILDPTRAVNWSQVGIPGGIPTSRTQCGSTILASTYNNGSADATSGIQTALNSCGSGHFLLLGPGTFRVNSGLRIPSNVTLRGSGADQTRLDGHGNGRLISFGNDSEPNANTYRTISSGATKGSTSFVLNDATSLSVGQLLAIGGTNASYMTEAGHGGTCGWCNNGFRGDAGQIVEITNINGTTVTFRPALYFDYSSYSPRASYFTAGAISVGLENIELYANNTGYDPMIWMDGSKYCWVKGVRNNFADNGHLYMWYSLGNEVRDSFFHDGFNHGPGGSDNQLNLARLTSSTLIENNIFWRQHVGIMLEWGSAGNVIAYNYLTGNYHESTTGWQIMDINFHGAHPFFNLFEGNIGDQFSPDDYWGSSSHTTIFRNYSTGARQYIPPLNARGALQTGSAAWEDTGNNFAYDLADLQQYINFVGSIAGSAHRVSAGAPGWKISPASAYSTNVCIRIGYDTSNNNAISPNTTYSTIFIHGVNDCQAGTFTWDSGHPDHTLPASFYLSSKPSYWGNNPWPGIGPDITGGTGWSGHVNPNPAQTCFNSVTSNGTSNTVPFNASICYGQQQGALTPVNPPLIVSAVAN
jgi:hypothetical protein